MFQQWRMAPERSMVVSYSGADMGVTRRPCGKLALK